MSEEDLKQETAASEDDNVEVELPEAAETSDQEERQDQEPEKVAKAPEDEHEQYSKNVQKRIKKLTEKYRQEERDKEEAARLAQVLREENEKLKAQIGSTQQAHLTEYGSRLENQLNITKQAIKDAHDRGDIDQMIEAQQALSKISIEQERYRLAKERQERVKVQQPEDSGERQVQQPVPQQQAAPEPDPKAQDWASKNEWFGQDEVMTYAAFGIHRKLVEEEGFDPTSDEYYDEIDKQIRSEFPHRFASQPKGRSSQVASADTSASRRPSGRRTVKLSPSQVAMAKKLNVPLEEYAKYVKD